MRSRVMSHATNAPSNAEARSYNSRIPEDADHGQCDERDEIHWPGPWLRSGNAQGGAERANCDRGELLLREASVVKICGPSATDERLP